MIKVLFCGRLHIARASHVSVPCPSTELGSSCLEIIRGFS